MKTNGFLFTASVVLAMALTFSCSSDGDGIGDGSFSEVAFGSINKASPSREDQTYKTVKIGTQTWMAENLNYDAEGSKCYGNDPANCGKYGRLYDWQTAMTVCPSGWHLPNETEWHILCDFVSGNKYEGSYSVAGEYLKATSGWNNKASTYAIPKPGLDSYGFAALPGGFFCRTNGLCVGNPGVAASDGLFQGDGDLGHWWTASDGPYKCQSITCGLAMIMQYRSAYVFGYNASKSHYMASVRCVKD